MKNIRLKSLLTEQDEENYIDQTVKAANDKLKELGVKGRIDPKKHFGKSLVTIDKGTETKFDYPLNALFEKLTYAVMVGGSPDGKVFHIVFDYSWEHRRGSNGYRETIAYNAKRKEWN